MVFFVLSDTHGDVETAVRVFGSLAEPVDRILHLGDNQRDGLRLESRLGVPVLALKGNCDGGYSQDEHRILSVECGAIYLSHGHMEAVKNGPENILYKASSLGCMAVFYGHTHHALYRDLGGICLLNPGSLTRPYGGSAGTYALVRTSLEGLDVSIRTVDPADRPTVAETGKTGASNSFFRRVLNESDRW